MVFGRPLFLIFLCLMAYIGIWYHFSGGDGEEAAENNPVECVGQIEEIQVKTSGKVLVLSDVQAINTESGEDVRTDKILVYDFSGNNLFSNPRVGNIVRIKGKYSTFTRASNPGGFDEYLYYGGQGISGRLFAGSFHVLNDRCNVLRQGLYCIRYRAMDNLLTVMEEEDAGILGAMILGDKTYLPEDLRELYQRVGIAHMLAISGLHISLLGAGLFFFLRSYVMTMKKAVIVTMVFLLLFGEFTGFPVATTRAVIMMCCSLFARYTGRSYDALSAMSLSGIVTLAQQPLQLFQCGFILSYTAMAGILLFSPVVERMDGRSGVIKSLVSGVSVFLVTLPVMLWFFYEICPYSVLANMVVLPFLALLIGVGIAGCALTFFWQGGGGFLLSTVHYIFKFYEFVCHILEKLPFSTVLTGRPPLILILLYYVIMLVAVYLYVNRKNNVYLFAGGGILAVILLLFPPDMEFLYIQLDVGQGDCACIFNGNSTYLIDGGSSSEKEIGKYTIQKLLKFYGRNRVDQIFITHSDADHTNGVQELVSGQERWGIEIKSIIMPEIQKKDDAYLSLIRMLEEYNTKVLVMRRGDRMVRGECSIYCVHPTTDYEWRSENDYSLTLSLSFRNLRILTTGDLEEDGESAVGALNGTYDILKVGHHGSKTSTSQEFLNMVSPGHAFISAGRNNRYGHPAAVTLEKLESAGVKIWNTMNCGAVFAECAGDEKRVYSYLGE